jgi:hypothetical protein
VQIFNVFYARTQGCQIFLGATYQNAKNIPYDLKIYQTGIKYTNLPEN